MTLPVIPTPATALPPHPSRGDDPDNFRAEADTFVAALPVFGTDLNTVGDDAYTNALSSSESAVLAAAQVVLAAAQAAIATTSANNIASNVNFQGNWGDQTGAATVPYSVYHTNIYWQLLVDIADVTASEPTTANTDWAVSVGSNMVGDVVYSVDATRYVTPQFLLCNGAEFDGTVYTQLAAVMPTVFKKLTDPATLPTGALQTLGSYIPWSSDDVYAAVPHPTTPFITIYKRTVDTFTKLANPGTLPTGNANGADIDPTDTYLSVAHNTTPFVTIYSRSGDVFTKLTNPATLPPSTAYATKFDSSAGHLAVSHGGSPFFTVYAITAGPTFTKIANPATLPASNVYSLSWASDSSYIACGGSGSPFINIYTLSGSTLTKVANPATLPSSTVFSVAFDPTDTYLAVASAAAPYLLIYKKIGSSFVKLSDSSISPGVDYVPEHVYFDQTGALYVTSAAGVAKYFRDGDFFELGASDFITSTDVGTAVVVSKSGTEAYAAIGGDTSPYVAFYKDGSYITPLVNVDTADVVRAYISTGE